MTKNINNNIGRDSKVSNSDQILTTNSTSVAIDSNPGLNSNKSISVSKSKFKPKKSRVLVGLRLMDAVNLGLLNINMAKTVQGFRKLANFNTAELSVEYDTIVSSSSSSSDFLRGPHILETVTLLAIILEDYYQTDRLCSVIVKSFLRLKSVFDFKLEVQNYRIVKVLHAAGELHDGSSACENSFIYKALKENGYTLDDLYSWIGCSKAKTLYDAMKSMELGLTPSYHDTVATTHRKWPQFLILFTLRRKCTSRLEANEALRLFQSTLPAVDKNWQFALFIRTLRILHQWNIEFVPTLCQFFLRHSDPLHNSSLHYNQMLWLVCKFGTKWSQDDSLTIAESLRLIVTDMSHKNIPIDTKGYLAIAYIANMAPSNDRAGAIVDLIKRHDYEFSKEELIARDKWSAMQKQIAINSNLKDNKANEENDYENDNDNEYNNDNEDISASASSPTSNSIGIFPYIHGVYAMELLISQDSYEALRKFDSIPRSSRISMLWAMLLTRLRDLGDLTPQMTEGLWKRIQEEKVSLGPYLIRRICDGLNDTTRALEVVSVANTKFPRMANKLRTETMSSLLQVRQRKDLNTIRHFLANFERRPFGLYDALLSGEARYDRGKAWKTYTSMRNDGYDPKTSTLISLCIAASDMRIRWGDLFAVQRAVVEFKMWVRGAAKDGSDKDDVLKVYPTPELFHRYIIMIGRAGYDQELLEVLPWMERIQFEPDKLCLCALIRYSPNGKHLLSHGQKVGGQWPTEYEFEQYVERSRRNK